MENSWTFIRATIEANPGLSDIEKKKRELDFLWQDLCIVRAREQAEFNSMVCVINRFKQKHQDILDLIETVLRELRQLEDAVQRKRKKPKVGAPRVESPLSFFAMLDESNSDTE